MDYAHELARDLRVLGEVEAARHLGEGALARARRVLGDESDFTMDVANNLAAALQGVGDLEAARRLVFGEDHPRPGKLPTTSPHPCDS